MSTTTEIITCEDPTCDVDLPCVSCTVTFLKATGEWENVKSSRIWADLERSESLVDSRPSRGHDATSTGTGSGGTSRGRGFRPATDKQLGFLIHLATKLGHDLPTEGLSSAEASEQIDLLLAEQKRREAQAPAQPEGPVVGRWKKTPSGWGIFAPGAEQGQEITVRRSSGEERQVVLGHQLGKDIYAEGKPSTSERQASRRGFEVVAGMAYRLRDGRIVSVQESRESGALYGKVWNGHSFEYAGARILREIDAQLTPEEARAFGLQTTHCCCCGRKLTRKSSIEAGIGPICAERWG